MTGLIRKGFFSKIIILKNSLLTPLFIYRVTLIAALVLLMGNEVWGQTTGDYRTNGSGDWNALGTWRRYNGTNWNDAPTAAQGYPGQYATSSTATVTIQNDQNVTLNVSPDNAIGNLVLQTGNRASYITFSGTNSLVVNSNTRIEVPTSTNTARYKYIRVLAGSFSTGSIVMDASSDNGRDSYIEISTGTVNVSGNVTMNSTDGRRNYILFSGNGTLNVGGTITGGIITSNAGGHQTTGPTSGTVNYNSSGNQTVGAYTYYNLTISGGGTKTLTGSVTITRVLTLNSGILQLGDNNATLSNTAANAIQGTPGNGSFIETNGNGVFIRPGNSELPILFPVGSGGNYAPVNITAISNNTGSLSIKTIPVAELGPKSLNRYWDIIAGNNRTITAEFTYHPSEAPFAPTGIWTRSGSGTWQVPSGTQSFGSNNFTTTGGNISTTVSSWTASTTGTYYSYQSGSWNDPTTWTSDPGGTTQVGTTIPDNDDYVVILSGRTVTLPADISSSGLNITINEGGFLDQGIYRFTSTLAELSGQGTLQLSSANLPVVTLNNFINPGGGTTEYRNTTSFNLSVVGSHSTYNNLIINIPDGIIATQFSDITINGNLQIKRGTLRINDNTAGTRLILNIYGDVTVNQAACLTVGRGSTNTSIYPTNFSGGTQPFLNYYEQFHRIVIYGSFTNNGTVRFTNLNYPVYNLFPPLGDAATSGAASVYFMGTSNSSLICNGTTDFYNLILDKGIDQTYSLTIQPSSYNNFRLFGANVSSAETGTSNPNLRKALWIRTGTLILKGLTIIPSLTEGVSGATFSSDYIIPINGALVLDGPDVIALATADDYGEVNLAYGVSGGTGAANGINTNGVTNPQGLLVYGRLQVNEGYLSTRESAGLLYNNVAAGQIEIKGGIVDVKQFRENGTTGSGASFVQSGGLLALRGRFIRPVAYATMDDLTSISGSLSARAANGTSGSHGSFNINNASNVFSMSGGTIRIYDACTTGNAYAIKILSSSANTNITGGTFELNSLNGTVLANSTSHLIESASAPFGNLSIFQGSGSNTTAQLSSYELTLLNDLRVNSGTLIASNLDVTIGGDFSISSGATYNSGINTTIFNGNSKQFFQIDGTINNGSQGLNNFSQDNNSDTVAISGSQASLYVQGTFILNGGTFEDGGKTIYVAGNITNSGTHVGPTGSGSIRLNGTTMQSIGGDGKGIFRNLTLDNNNAAVSPVSLTSSITINGVLTFLRDKNLNIGTYNLKLTENASIISGDATSYIQTSGNSGDGGLTKIYSSGSPSFTFPIGAPTLNPVRVSKYTPAIITVNGTATSYGSITIIPVGYEHPATLVNGVSLTYFWRVKSTGFNLGSATITHGYTYGNADMAGITQSECIAARYHIPTYSWTTGGINDVDEVNKIIGEPGTGSFLEAVSFIDGDYTAGDNTPTNPFGIPRVFYSRINGAGAGNGLWSAASTWSFTGNSGPANTEGAVPGINDIVVISGNDSIYLDRDRSDPWETDNVDPRSCASLQIERGSVLDMGFNTNSVFSMVVSHPNGNGNFRVTTSSASGTTFKFPSGDFSDFNQNLGTTELYTTNPTAGTTYWLPNNIQSYGNLIISPLGGSNIIFGNTDLTVYGNLITRGQNSESWFCPTWNSNYPTTPVTRAAKTITVFGNMDLQGGALIFYGNGSLAQNFIIHGDVIVSTNAGIMVYGSATNQSMQIGGSLINNAAFGTGVNLYRGCNFTSIPLTFFGNNNAFITNTSGTPSTTLQNVTVYKGSSQNTLLTIDIGGTFSTPADNWLTLQNGTLRYMRNNPSSDFTISTGTPFIIPPTAGLLIDYSNNRNVLLANLNNNNNDVILNGKLTIINGNVYVGRVNGTDNNNNDIEYSGGGASEIEIQGGTLTVNGQIRRNPAISNGILKYNQSGGTVTINGRNANSTNAKFEILNNESHFQMSGGTLIIVRGNGTSAFGDVFIRPGSSSVTGGIIQFAHNLDNLPQTYRLDASVPLNDIMISGRTTGTAANAQVNLMVNPLVLKGSLTLSNLRSILNANNMDVTVQGDFINNGSPASYLHGTNRTTFNGNVQNLTGSSITNFYDLKVSPLTSLTLSNNVIVYHNLELEYGTLICGPNSVVLEKDFINNATYTDTQFGVILRGTSGQQLISGTGTFGRLELDNTDGARIANHITLNQDLVLTKGSFNINRYMLTLGQNSNIGGTSFGSSKMIITDGVFSDVGITKIFGAGPKSFTFPIGVNGKYTPAELTITANASIGSIRVNNINSRHPGIVDPNNVLQYFWEVESSGITGFSGSMILNYSVNDVLGGPESNYVDARLIVPGTSWQKGATGADQVDEINHRITFNFPAGTSNLNGEYTAGNDLAIPDAVPVYTTNSDGNWNDPSIWTQTSGDPFILTGGPNGFIVIINHNVIANTNYCQAYRTTINKKLQLESPYFGHNLGTVDGSGTLYLESSVMPAGRFDDFLDCDGNSTLEYGGSGCYTINADLFNQVPNVLLSGTGIRILPNKDLTICHTLNINGPALDNSTYNKKLTILGTMVRTSGTFNSGIGPGATVSFTGTSAQTLGNFSGANGFNNLEIDNTEGLTLIGPITVSGNLMLTDGIIRTSSVNSLSITNTSVSSVIPSGGSDNSYISGPLTKTLVQGDTYFKFPVGNSSVPGNKLSLRATQTGTLDWTVEYINPSGLLSVSAPLTTVNETEYWNVSTPSGGGAIVQIEWDPASNLTPLMTQNGISDMRVAEHNGTNWTELGSVRSGDNYNGYSETSSRVVIAAGGNKNYTLACINAPKPRIRLAPAGAVCGTSGIPLTLSSAYDVYPPFTIEFTINGVPQTPLTPASFPATLPTLSTGGVFQLTGFTYNRPAGTLRTGVVDVTTVTTYAVPTTSNAGGDQSLCGATSATLSGNNPLTGTGLWSIISGTGGTVTTPTSPTSTFNGTNGTTYILRWTISNGACTSSDNVTISFPLLAAQPQNFTSSSSEVCQGEDGVPFTIPNDPSVTYTWTYSGTGYDISGTGNAVTVDFDNTATSGTFSVIASNTCGSSAPRSIAVTVHPMPAIALATGSTELCFGLADAPLAYTGTTHSPDRHSVTYGAAAITEGFVHVTNSVLTASLISLVVPSDASVSDYTGDLFVTNSTTGCISDPYPFSITINPLPVPTISGPNTCAGIPVNYQTENGMSDYIWTITPGSGTISDPADVYNPQVTWGNVTGLYEDRVISVNYTDANGCKAASPASMNVRIFKIPQTGPAYRLPNE